MGCFSVNSIHHALFDSLKSSAVPMEGNFPIERLDVTQTFSWLAGERVYGESTVGAWMPIWEWSRSWDHIRAINPSIFYHPLLQWPPGKDMIWESHYQNQLRTCLCRQHLVRIPHIDRGRIRSTSLRFLWSRRLLLDGYDAPSWWFEPLRPLVFGFPPSHSNDSRHVKRAELFKYWQGNAHCLPKTSSLLWKCDAKSKKQTHTLRRYRGSVTLYCGFSCIVNEVDEWIDLCV